MIHLRQNLPDSQLAPQAGAPCNNLEPAPPGSRTPARAQAVRFPARITALAAFALAVVLYGPTARADETATIYNESNYNVELYLKWSDLFYRSPKIVLAPGEWRRVSGPNGARLFIRFNSTPFPLPPTEVTYRVITRYTFYADEPGYISRFRDVAPYVVDLFAP